MGTGGEGGRHRDRIEPEELADVFNLLDRARDAGVLEPLERAALRGLLFKDPRLPQAREVVAEVCRLVALRGGQRDATAAGGDQDPG
jgi:hypothetical protein